MAIASASSSLTMSGGLFSQIQQQQAQRNAEQAAAKARVLQGQARDAQAEADRAQENASTIKVQAEQANSDAGRAQQGLASMKSLSQTQAQFSGLREQLATIKRGTDAQSVITAPSAGGLVPVLNSFGQPTGTMVNVVA